MSLVRMLPFYQQEDSPGDGAKISLHKQSRVKQPASSFRFYSIFTSPQVITSRSPNLLSFLLSRPNIYGLLLKWYSEPPRLIASSDLYFFTTKASV